MRRFSPLLLVCSLVVSAATVGVAATAASASSEPSDLPSGFVDGVPVGSGDAPATTPADTIPAEGAAPAGEAKADAVPVTKYFGQGPFEAINAAAEATPRCTGLSAPGPRRPGGLAHLQGVLGRNPALLGTVAHDPLALRRVERRHVHHHQRERQLRALRLP